MAKENLPIVILGNANKKWKFIDSQQETALQILVHVVFDSVRCVDIPQGGEHYELLHGKEHSLLLIHIYSQYEHDHTVELLKCEDTYNLKQLCVMSFCESLNSTDKVVL